MMLRRMLEGALKWALRDLRLEDEMAAGGLLILGFPKIGQSDCYSLLLTLAIVIDRADGGQGVEALTGDHRDLDEKRRSENKMRVLWVCRNWWALQMAENGLTVFLLRSSAVLLTYRFGVWIPEQGGSSAHQHETTRRRLIWTIISSYPKAVLCPVYPGPQSKKRKRKQNQNQNQNA